MAKSYHISFNATGWTEFFPSNDPVITTEQEGEEIFKRYSIETLRIERNNDNETIYDTIDGMYFNAPDFSSPLYFKVQKSGVDKYFFKSSVNETNIDTQNAVFEIAPRTNDDYEPIMGKYDVVYQDLEDNNLFGVASSFHIEELINNLFINQDFTTFADAAKSVTWTNTSGGTQYALLAFTGANVDDIIQVAVYDFAGDSFDLALVLADGTTLNSNTEVVSADGIYSLVQSTATSSAYIRIRAIDFAAGISGSFKYKAYEPNQYANKGKQVKDLIEDLLGSSYMDLSYDVVSTYLWNDALETDPPPGIDTYITANSTKDYVVEDTAIWNYLFITKMHSFTVSKNPVYEITFGDLMGMLKTKLRAYWFIDSDDKIRIEHEKYFRDYDSQLTVASYSVYKPEVDALNYNYDKGDIYSVVNYSESNAENPDFIAAPIIYDQTLTTPKSKDVTSPLDISTDMDYITTESPSTAGYALIQCTKSGAKYYCTIGESFYDADVFYANQKLSWAYLFNNYWSYFGEADEADINTGTTLSLDGVKTFLKQGDISFFYSGELDWKKPITTSNGTAWIEKIEETDSEFLTLNIGFDPYL